MTAPRPWGWWTRHKLQILEDYLKAFATASKSVPERIYLDLFAGRPDNVSRETGETILGSVHRALAASPPFTRVHLFELPSNASALEARVRQSYPNRPGIQVHPGDCNHTVDDALGRLARARVDWAPTFAFIDQQAAEVHWQTLDKISRFRRGKTKAEMWILFGSSFLPRGLEINQDLMNAAFADRITAMFGTEQWVPIIAAQRDGYLQPAEARFELVNLMRWRLETDLGYRKSHTFTMKNTGGQEIYQMIFTSDHEAGDRIMQHLYGKAVEDHESMRRDALALHNARRQERRSVARGETPLFDLDTEMVQAPKSHLPSNRIYCHEPPREPYKRQ